MLRAASANQTVTSPRNHDRMYATGGWERVRRQVLNRDEWRCRSCGHPGDLEVDHVVPMSRGGAALDLSNLQTMCSSCHVEKTDREAGRDPERRAWRRFVREMTA